METSDSPTLANVARWMIIVGIGFFLLRELGDILKPLFLAILLGYVILPLHLQVKRRVPGKLSLVASIGITLTTLFITTLVVQSSVRTLSAEVPHLTVAVRQTIDHVQTEWSTRYPASWKAMSDFVIPARTTDGAVREMTARLVSAAADTVSTAAVVGLYLVFLLLEAGRLPDKVRQAFTGPRSEQILLTIHGINEGIAGYLSAKVKSSFVLALPIWIILFVFNTPFSLIWAVLVFFCNFVPYVGSLVGYTLPALFVGYQFGFGWESIVVCTLMLAMHATSAFFLEPALIGKAVGLSPIVILLSLAFWGYCWGLTGMLLAVPIVVMIKIICSHIESTRPLAKLVSDA